jgi:hypothetical protein
VEATSRRVEATSRRFAVWMNIKRRDAASTLHAATRRLVALQISRTSSGVTPLPLFMRQCDVSSLCRFQEHQAV